MATITSDPLKALLFIWDGQQSWRWNSKDGEAVSLSYHFASAAPSYYTGVNSIANFRSLYDYERQAAASALASIASAVQISFSEDASMESSTDITFGATSSGMSSGVYAYAYTPYHSSAGEADFAGDVWLNVSKPSTEQTFSPSGYGYLALIHEIGHGLGLKHPFAADSAKGYILEAAKDNRLYTVMSYTAAPNSYVITQSGDSGIKYTSLEPETLMLYDIAALQSLYGANMTYATEDNVYTFDPEKPFLKTIWDAGGIDTIDIHNFTEDSKIDLTAGSFSSLKMIQDIPSGYIIDASKFYNGTNNLTIAYGVTIERAIGGSGNDIFLDNAVDNYLSGEAGDDSLFSTLGNDTLSGGDGDDQFTLALTDGSSLDITGGAGVDTYQFASVKLLTGSRSISDFSSDKIDLEAPLLESMKLGYSSGNPFSVDLGYFKLLQSASDTLLQWDKDGEAKTGFDFETLLTLKDIDTSDITADDFVQKIDPTGTSDYKPEVSAILISYTDTAIDDKFVALKGAVENPFGVGTKYSLLNDAGVVVSSMKTKYGSLTLSATTGAYSFTPVDAAIESLGESESFSQALIVKLKNGVSSLDRNLVVTVTGANDQASFIGTTSALMTEDSKLNIAKGKLAAKDRDLISGASFDPQTTSTDYGTFSSDATGAWQYQLNNLSASVQALSAKSKTPYQDIFELTTADGSVQKVTVTIKGVDDKSIITGTSTGSVIEDDDVPVTGALTLTDVDLGEGTFTEASLVGKYGVLAIDADGAWSYQLDNASVAVQALMDNKLMLDSFSVTTSAGLSQAITIKVQGQGKTITGTSGADNLTGSDQDDVIKAGLGSDTLSGGLGHDSYEIDTINDTIIESSDGGYDRVLLSIVDKTVTSYALADEVENLTLSVGLSQLALSGNELHNHIVGNALANKVMGLSGNDLLNGAVGNDSLEGGDGQDILLGGVGLDLLTGGADADGFVFDLPPTAVNNDMVSDFSVEDGDRIFLSLSAFKKLGVTAGVLASEQFVVGKLATSADQRIVYDDSTGKLFYDADGSGKGVIVLIATLANKPKLTAEVFESYLPTNTADLSAVIVGVQADQSVLLY